MVSIQLTEICGFLARFYFNDFYIQLNSFNTSGIYTIPLKKSSKLFRNSSLVKDILMVSLRYHGVFLRLFTHNKNNKAAK